MSDVPLASPTPSPSTAATAATAQGVTTLQVAVLDVPAALQNLTRIIQTNATPIAVSDTSSITLSTALGNVRVSLSPSLSAAERQNLTQHLMTLVPLAKPLALTLQAGSPPAQGALQIPTPTATAPVQNVHVQPHTATPAVKPSTFTPGETFRAIVLPPSPGPAAVLASGAAPPKIAGLAALRAAPAPEVIIVGSAPLPVAQNAQQASASAQTPTAPWALTSETPEEYEQAPRPALTNTGASSRAEGAFLSSPRSVPMAVASAPTPQAASSALPPMAQAPALPPLSTPAPEAGARSAPLPNAPVPPLASDPQPQPAASRAAPSSEAAPARFQTAPAPLQAASLLSPGSEVSLRITSFLPSAPASSRFALENPLSAKAAPPALAANEIVATVTGTGTGGQLILKAGDATLFLKSQVTAPLGTSVIVSVTPAKDDSLVTLPQADKDALPSLAPALDAFQHAAPLAFQKFFTGFMPQPNEALSGALIFFLSAFKHGNLGGWLGDDGIETLRKSAKPDILRHLMKDFSVAAPSAQDPVVGEWRSYPIPLYAQQQFQSITLFVHSDRDARKDQAKAQGAGSIRFLIDMRLSKLGAMQVDGFVQPRKLDMILRSEKTLPPGLPNELRTAYIKALDATGYAGSLNFQVGRQHWMVMQKAAPAGIVT